MPQRVSRRSVPAYGCEQTRRATRSKVLAIALLQKEWISINGRKFINLRLESRRFTISNDFISDFLTQLNHQSLCRAIRTEISPFQLKYLLNHHCDISM